MKISIQTVIWTLVAVGIVVAAALALMPKTIDVETVLVEQGRLRVSVQEDGKTRIREKYIISAPVAGRLSRIELKPGDEVSYDGSLLAVIVPADPAMLDARAQAQARARVDQARAAVKRSQANASQIQTSCELSQTRYDRAKELLNSQSIAQSDFDLARAEFLSSSQAVRMTTFDLEIAQFELKMAEAALMQFSELQEEQVEPFEIMSPIAGKVLRVFQESSTVVGVGAPLIELGDPGNLEIEIDVLSTDAVRIKPYAELTIEYWGGDKPLQGNVRMVEPAAFTKVSSLGVEEQRVNVIADFNEPPERLATLGDGYRVEARITISDHDNVLLIPNSALFRYRREWHVFTVVDDTARMKQVAIGARNESQTRVIDGLTPGDEVIVYPSDQISDGVRVRRAN